MNLARHAFEVGKGLDLGHCIYGPAAFDPSGFANRTSPYYFFLAGYAQIIGARNVVEIGTHYGGSTLAIDAGLAALGRDFDYGIVTADVEDKGNPLLHDRSRVTTLIADVSRPEGYAAVAAAARRRSPIIDLLYIDALKDETFLLSTIETFTHDFTVLNIVLDDIAIVGAMRRGWSRLIDAYGSLAIPIHELEPEVRQPSVGFGLIVSGAAPAFSRSAA